MKSDNAQARRSKDVDIADISDVDGISDRNTGLGKILERQDEEPIIDTPTTAGDIDSNQYQASVVGDEAVGGLASTPEQNDIDELAKASGISLSDQDPVNVTSMLEERDEHRWELDPDSANPVD